MAGKRIRPAVSAGEHKFYPSDRRRLDALLDEMLGPDAPAGQAPEGPEPLALVVPHAGYRFSGPTAARAYRLLRGRRFDRVIVVAPSHYARFAGASVFDGDSFETPLGLVEVDRAFVQELLRDDSLFHFYPAAEEREHSLEVQLPFLMRVLTDFRLVPVLISDQSYDNVSRVARALRDTMHRLGGKTLLVASSDLYHGPNHQYAMAQSREAAAALERLNPEDFLDGIEAGEYQACGAGAIGAAMMVALAEGARSARVVDLTTSYEVYPVRDDYVVGYLSAVLS
ncbi:MAG: AmmeMemoRadiSam system protein B [Candidatus Sumerlaeaceae bacterium]|nr:AmmeMemoRadiSam system protein B [Candidatus Sumerlaeaceae bacterium]